jgi:hypothetical protein
VAGSIFEAGGQSKDIADQLRVRAIWRTRKLWCFVSFATPMRPIRSETRLPPMLRDLFDDIERAYEEGLVEAGHVGFDRQVGFDKGKKFNRRAQPRQRPTLPRADRRRHHTNSQLA